MKRSQSLNTHAVVLFIALVACAIFFPGTVAIAGEQGAVPDAKLNVSGELRTGSTVKATFDLKDYRFPLGTYPSINVRFMDKPEGAEPKVKAGYPETSLVFSEPGLYRIGFILNEVSKPSCGGVDAKALMEKNVELQIAE